MSPKTLYDYRSLSRTWITHHIGKHRPDQLRPEHLDAMYTAMSAAGMAGSSIAQVHLVIRRPLEIAVRRDDVARNIAELIDAPSAGHADIEPLIQEEARKILRVAISRRNGARWSVGLALSLRQGDRASMEVRESRIRRDPDLVAAPTLGMAARL